MNKEDKSVLELYTRTHYTTAEKIYEKYMDMRDIINNQERIKYDIKDKYCANKDFKQGFIAGAKIMMSIFLDL